MLSDHKGDIKIADFGLAVKKILNQDMKSTFLSEARVGGTGFFIDPEFFESTGKVIGRKSDIWLVEILHFSRNVG